MLTRDQFPAIHDFFEMRKLTNDSTAIGLLWDIYYTLTFFCASSEVIIDRKPLRLVIITTHDSNRGKNYLLS